MSDAASDAETRVDRVRDLLETVERRARTRRRGRGRAGRRGRSAACSQATTSDSSSAATGRRSTPSSTSRSRSPTATRSRGGVRVVVDAAGYRARREQALHRQADQAAATRPRRPPGRARRHERDRAQGRARAPEGPRRRRDVLRGHRAGPPPRRGAAPTLPDRFTFYTSVKHLRSGSPCPSLGHRVSRPNTPVKHLTSRQGPSARSGAPAFHVLRPGETPVRTRWRTSERKCRRLISVRSRRASSSDCSSARGHFERRRAQAAG